MLVRSAPSPYPRAASEGLRPNELDQLYLNAVLDPCSRFVVGWRRSAVDDERLMLTALEMAVQRTFPYPWFLRQSDRSGTYRDEDCETYRAGRCVNADRLPTYSDANMALADTSRCSRDHFAPLTLGADRSAAFRTPYLRTACSTRGTGGTVANAVLALSSTGRHGGCSGRDVEEGDQVTTDAADSSIESDHVQ